MRISFLLVATILLFAQNSSAQNDALTYDDCRAVQQGFQKSFQTVVSLHGQLTQEKSKVAALINERDRLQVLRENESEKIKANLKQMGDKTVSLTDTQKQLDALDLKLKELKDFAAELTNQVNIKEGALGDLEDAINTMQGCKTGN